jgi:hypothetical protein
MLENNYTIEKINEGNYRYLLKIGVVAFRFTSLAAIKLFLNEGEHG